MNPETVPSRQKQANSGYESDLRYLESLIRADYERCHPDDSFEDLKHRAHFAKEDRGLLRDWLAIAARPNGWCSPKTAGRLCTGGGKEQMTDTNAPLSVDSIVDVRSIIPRERHPLIFNTFERLEPTHAFVLVNDHDPKPLYYQFQAEHQGKFNWDYLEKGPDVWRVVISRTA